MENISSRIPARFVGYFDLILTIIGAVSLIVVIIKNRSAIDLDFEKDYFLIIFLSIIGLAVAVLYLLFIYFTILFLKATKLTADPTTSLKQVKIWLAMNIFVFMLGIIIGVSQLLRGEWISLVVLLCVRGPLIWLVQSYKEELAGHCAEQPFLLLSTPTA